MSTDERSRYRRELKGWSKNELVREVERLRAITREHADRPGEDTAPLQGSMVDAANDPYSRGTVLMDARHAILMDEVDVCLVDAQPGESRNPATARLSLVVAGRVNMRDERSSVLLMFGWDGAAALITQCYGLASRAGGGHLEELHRLVDERIDRLP